MRLSILVLFSVAVLLLTSCGSGDGSHRLSEAAFRSRANHICSELTRQEKPDLGSTSKVAVDRNLGRIDSALSQLEGLRPPAHDEQRYRAMLTSFKRSVAFVKANEPRLIQMARDLRSHPSDRGGFMRYARLFRPFLQEVAIAGNDAKALGLGACATGLSGASSG
jgi:hypothetical protein